MEEQNISDSPVKAAIKIFDLIMGRVFKSVYLKLSEDDKKKMERIFLSENDKEKEEFIKEYMPNFEEVFKEETAKFEQELKAKM